MLLVGIVCLSSSLVTALPNAIPSSCPDFDTYSQQKHAPLSSGQYKLSYMRPSPACRTFNNSVVNNAITKMSSKIADPDLYRLFENACKWTSGSEWTWSPLLTVPVPNTLDTTVKWRGTAAGNPAEELTFVITGDMYVQWQCCLISILTRAVMPCGSATRRTRCNHTCPC